MELTRNWGSIQIKSIDPYADVASDVTSRLTKIMGADNVYVNGFDLIKYESDSENNCIAVTLGPGICIVSNIVIEITNTTTSKLVGFPIPTIDNYCLVVEYIYAKTTPAPIAVIKGVKLDELDPRIHLPLYNFRLNGWNTYINNTILTTWINSNDSNFKDERHKTGYLPRSGGTVYGKLYSTTIAPTDPFEVTNKQFVEKVVSDALGGISGIGLLQNVVMKTGAEMIGPITMQGDPLPLTSNQLITRSYVDTRFVNKAGDTMQGPLLLKSNPSRPLEAATKDYVDNGVQHAISNMHISMRHGDLQQLNEDHHQQYVLANGARGFNGPVDGVDPLTPKNLTTRSYVDSIANTINARINAIVAGGGGSGGGVAEHNKLLGLSADDHPQYSLVSGARTFTGPIGGIDPTDPSHLATKRYVDNSIGNVGSNISHHTLQNLSADDHPQYIKADGSRSFTQPISAPAPTISTNLVNLEYMSNYVTEQIAIASIGGGSGGSGGTLPPGVKYVTSDGSVDFTAPVEGIPGSSMNSLVTLGQVGSMFDNQFNDHQNLTNRDSTQAHPQYLLLSGGTMTGFVSVLPPVENEHAVDFKTVKTLETQVNAATVLINTHKENIEAIPSIKTKVEEHSTVIGNLDDTINTKFTNLINNDIQPLLDTTAKLNGVNKFTLQNFFEKVTINKNFEESFTINKAEDFTSYGIDSLTPTVNSTYTYTTDGGMVKPRPYSLETFPSYADLYGFGYIDSHITDEFAVMNEAPLSANPTGKSYRYDWTFRNLGPTLQIGRSPLIRTDDTGEVPSNTNGKDDTVLSIVGATKSLSSNVLSPLIIRHSNNRNQKLGNLVGAVPISYFNVIPGSSAIENGCDASVHSTEISKYAPIGSIYYVYDKATKTITSMFVKIKAGSDSEGSFTAANFRQIF